MAFIWTEAVHVHRTPLRVTKSGGHLKLTFSAECFAKIAKIHGKTLFYRIGYDAAGHKLAVRFQSAKAPNWRPGGTVDRYGRLIIRLNPDDLCVDPEEITGGYEDFAFSTNDQMWICDTRRREIIHQTPRRRKKEADPADADR